MKISLKVSGLLFVVGGILCSVGVGLILHSEAISFILMGGWMIFLGKVGSDGSNDSE